MQKPTYEQLKQRIHQLEKAVSKANQTEELLRKTQDQLWLQSEKISSERQKFFDLVETLPVMVCLLTPDHRVVFDNRAFRQKFGESGGRRCYEYCCGYDKPCPFCEAFIPLKTGRPHYWEFTSPDGNIIVDAYDIPFTDLDGSPRILEIDIDITERKLAEKALRESEKRSSALVRASSDVVYRMSPDWKEMRYLNGQDFIADTEAPTRSWLEKYIHPDDQPQVMSVINRAIQTKGIFEMEHRVLRPDGSLGWTFSRAIPILDDRGGIVEWFGMAKDISNRKETEEASRIQLMEIESYYDNAPIGLAVLDKELRYLRINNVLAEINGFPVAAHIGKTVKEVVPMLESKTREIVSEISRTGKDVTNIEFTGETNARPGIQRTWLLSWFPLKNKEEIVRFIVMVQDITERKIREEEIRKLNADLERKVIERSAQLRASEEKYRAVVEDQTELICRFKADGTITFVNEKYCQFFGKNYQDLLGSKWQAQAYKGDLQKIKSRLNKISAENPVVVIENRVLDVQGRKWWMQFVNRGLFDEKGRLSEIQSVARDITMLKDNEQTLLNREKKIQKQAEELHKINTAMEVLLEHRNRQIEQYNENIYRSFNKFILTDLERLKKNIRIAPYSKTISMIIKHIEELLSFNTDNLASEKFGLTKTELKIAKMIQSDMTGKEIAEHLNISLNTVGFHKKNLRKKLKIGNSKMGLSSYLKQL